jgi:superfamily I DNA/RNA helicase
MLFLYLDNARKIRRAVQDSLSKRDEENRVWYVAITRAKQKLYLHRAKIERNGYQL